MPSYSAFVCPACLTTVTPAIRVGAIVVCAHCGASVVVDEAGAIRRATAADTTVLSPADLQALRASRGRTR